MVARLSRSARHVDDNIDRAFGDEIEAAIAVAGRQNAQAGRHELPLDKLQKIRPFGFGEIFQDCKIMAENIGLRIFVIE